MDFKDMAVWKDAMNVSELVFSLTDNLPKKEDYGFTSQIRRSALSISANIAEAGVNHNGSIETEKKMIERGYSKPSLKQNWFPEFSN